jgi:putative nucleotidyltransferase with HDIG domain
MTITGADMAQAFGGAEIDDLNRRFSLDEMDNWNTSAGLAESAKKLAARLAAGYEASVFVLVAEAREYREIDREGIASIPEDSLFTGCLSMQEEPVGISRFFSDYSIEDPFLEALLTETYQGRWILPVVHRFRLLAFILLGCETDRDPPFESKAVRPLINRLKINLYAAMVADSRQRQLVTISEFLGILRRYPTLDEMLAGLLPDIKGRVPFDAAVLYLHDDFEKILFPRVWDGIPCEPAVLASGEGISGHIYQSGHGVAVPDRSKHPSFALLPGEEFVTESFAAVPVATGKRNFGVLLLARNRVNGDGYGAEHRYLLEIIASFLAEEMDSRLIYNELENSYFNTIKSLTRALEAKDPYTSGHSERVMEISLGIARNLGLSESTRRTIRYGAILHDIGKIGIKDALIGKPDTLSEDEFEDIKKHTEIGYNILDAGITWNEVRKLIRYHHERMDGSGYYGRKHGDYPWEAMIISLADIYDAITTERSYHKPMDRIAAVAALTEMVDINFDRKIFHAFLEYLSEIEAGSAAG